MNPAALGALLKGDIDNAVVAASPGGIERQEAEGQRNLVAHADRLPVVGTIDGMGSRGAKPGQQEQWEKVGFVFGEPLTGPDQIFVACTFPKGWSLKPTDHSMWSDVLDDKGRKRASVFFKAAFYDYNAHTFGLESRYQTDCEYDKKYNPTAAIVKDRATGETLHSIPISDERSYSEQDAARRGAEEWLDANYSDWKNPLAYWD